MSFRIEAKSGLARAGVLETPRGPVQTPAFMPVATQAAVKALDSDDMRRLGVRAMLANSYHLYLRPGVEVVKAAGGLHKFMDWDGFILTDSGASRCSRSPTCARSTTRASPSSPTSTAQSTVSRRSR
ncbi:MAG: tRNA-guanine transglycosylase [Elusimicrobiota bacterium]|nr:MAG: tRNA-guanine transglycosylase [Elusimicrobiota bacterium]